MLSTAISGLLAFQRALATTSNNITNVNTEGYTRQVVSLGTRSPQLIGNGYLGKGVDVTAINRVYDSFLVSQVNDKTSSTKQYEAYSAVASQIDSTFGSADVGLAPALENFFNSLQDVANNPTSTPARQVLLSEASSLNSKFNTLNRQVEDLRSGINKQLEATSTSLNSLATSIADLNQSIIAAQGAAGGGQPNDLLDQRDVLVRQLAELTDVTTLPQGDGSLNVYIGTGQSLVLGVTASKIATTRNEFDALDVGFSVITGSTATPITEQLSGGKIGGLLDVKRNLLNTTQDALGRVAIGMANTFNAQHQLGDDLNGNAGGLFFTDVDVSSPKALPSSNNNPASGAIGITIDDVNQLQVSEYRLNYDGSNFTLLRMSDLTVVDTFATADLPRTMASEGFTLNLTGSVASGDQFMVRPVRYAAGNIGLAISDPASFAAAASGNAVGDNSNALALAALQTQKSLGGGTASFLGAYGELVADIGVKTNQARVSGAAQQGLLNQAVDAQQGLSGVNLDEEAANLIKYQQAYQASAKIISVVDSLFQTLINAVGR